MNIASRAFILIALMAAFARAETPKAADDPLGEPVELGFRFTPEIARAIGASFTDDVLIRRYQLPPEKKDQAAKAVAQRIMTAAHATDGPAAEFFEFYFAQSTQARAEGRRDRDNITPDFAKGFSEKMTPLIPALRDMVRDVGQDVRPLLPLKQQIKLTADMMLATTGLDAFEKNMQLWAKGQVNGNDPFAPEPQQVQVDESGQSVALKAAKQSATQNLDSGSWMQWKEYLEQAKRLYAMDDAQKSTADAVLREFLERVQVTTQKAEWRQQVYRNRLWYALLVHFPLARNNPLRQFVDIEYAKLLAPIGALESDFKKRVDEIPTEAQRTKAEANITAIIAQQGVE